MVIQDDPSSDLGSGERIIVPSSTRVDDAAPAEKPAELSACFGFFLMTLLSDRGKGPITRFAVTRVAALFHSSSFPRLAIDNE